MEFTKIVFLACLALTVSAQDQGTNYNAGDHGRSETVGPDGEVTGQYHYTDSEGKLITVKYRAGKEGFQVEGDHLPKAPQPQGPAPAQQPQYYNNQPQQPQQPFFQQQPQQPQYYNPQQQYQQQPQQQYQPQPQQYQPQQQQYQQPQPQPQLPTPQLFQNFGQQQQHPNALQGQNFFQSQPQPQPQPQYYNQGQQQQGQYRPTKVSVSQNPGTGFTYNIES